MESSVDRDRGTEVPAGLVLVVIPTYNEVGSLPDVVARVFAACPGVEILVVDDNSPDGTGVLADELALTHPGLRVLHRTAKQGLGAAYLAGFREALAGGYELVVEMDADGSHLPEQLPRLLAPFFAGDRGGSLLTEQQTPGLVLGSRYVPNGAIHDWSLGRRVLSRGGNRYIRLLLGIDVRDATGGFRVFRRSTLQAIDLESVQSTGYVFQADLLWRTLRRGLDVVEVPIDFVERREGESKMTGEVAWESLRRVTRWGLTQRFNHRRPR